MPTPHQIAKEFEIEIETELISTKPLGRGFVNKGYIKKRFPIWSVTRR
jgi:hypothetical protein